MYSIYVVLSRQKKSRNNQICRHNFCTTDLFVPKEYCDEIGLWYLKKSILCSLVESADNTKWNFLHFLFSSCEILPFIFHFPLESMDWSTTFVYFERIKMVCWRQMKDAYKRLFSSTKKGFLCSYLKISSMVFKHVI